MATPLLTRSIVLAKWLSVFRLVPWLAAGPALLGLALAISPTLRSRRGYDLAHGFERSSRRRRPARRHDPRPWRRDDQPRPVPGHLGSTAGQSGRDERDLLRPPRLRLAAGDLDRARVARPSRMPCAGICSSPIVTVALIVDDLVGPVYHYRIPIGNIAVCDARGAARRALPPGVEHPDVRPPHGEDARGPPSPGAGGSRGLASSRPPPRCAGSRRTAERSRDGRPPFVIRGSLLLDPRPQLPVPLDDLLLDVGGHGLVRLDDLIEEKHRGVRPASGYPTSPDHTEEHDLWRLLDAEAAAGIVLTGSFAMHRRASVSGLYFSHPQCHLHRYLAILCDGIWLEPSTHLGLQRPGLPRSPQDWNLDGPASPHHWRRSLTKSNSVTGR